jgi:hypothetical protein
VKLNIFCCAVFLFAAFQSSGQILVGPVVGGQANFYSYDDKGYKDLYRVGPSYSYHVGASVALKIQKTIFLQTSFLYNERKKVMEGKVDPLFRNELKNRFIDVPILFTKEIKMKFGADKYFKWYLGVGPNISYWLGGKGVFKNSELNENEINPPNYDLPFEVTFGKAAEDVQRGDLNVAIPNRYQFGLNFSAGIILEPENVGKFMVATRFQLGHSFMSEKSKGDFGMPNEVKYEDDLRFQNHSLNLSLYYFIDLKTSERKKGKSTIKPKNRNSLK